MKVKLRNIRETGDSNANKPQYSVFPQPKATNLLDDYDRNELRIPKSKRSLIKSNIEHTIYGMKKSINANNSYGLIKLPIVHLFR